MIQPKPIERAKGEWSLDADDALRVLLLRELARFECTRHGDAWDVDDGRQAFYLRTNRHRIDALLPLVQTILTKARMNECIDIAQGLARRDGGARAADLVWIYNRAGAHTRAKTQD